MRKNFMCVLFNPTRFVENGSAQSQSLTHLNLSLTVSDRLPIVLILYDHPVFAASRLFIFRYLFWLYDYP